MNISEIEKTRAQLVETSIDFDGRSLLTLSYKIDNDFYSSVPMKLPYPLSLSMRQVSGIGLVSSLLVAKLALAENVVLDFPCSLSMLRAVLPMLGLLYNVRCYRDQRPLLPLPAVTLQQERDFPAEPRNRPRIDPKRVYLLWSGGKDSTLSLQLLRANGFHPVTIHATVNYPTDHLERKAAQELGALLDSSPEFLEIDSLSLVEVGRRYSPTFDRFPLYNAIPHGRDFVLMALLAMLAFADGSCLVSTGSEYELYSKVIQYGGTAVYRHDSQSEMGYRLLSSFLQEEYKVDFMAFSPVAPLTEFRSFKVLLDTAPQTMSHLNSCFWGHWCGQCFKCFRYSLIQRVLGKELLKFQVETLDESPFVTRYLNDPMNFSLPYWQEVHYCLSQLALREHWRQRFPVLKRYAQAVLPTMSDKLDDMYSNYLMATHPASLMPEGFDATLLG